MIMKAVQVRQWGGWDASNIEDVERPQIGAGEVLIRVKAASINPLDWSIREGYLQEYVSLPYMLGSDVSGDIEALGEGVEGLAVGMPVYGMKGLRGGTFAEYTTMHPGEFATKPTTLTYKEAAAVPHAALTAWQALNDVAELKQGQRILIHAAAGGVGHYAVQFAKLKGAYVIGTGSAKNEAFIRELGADEFIDYPNTPFETVVKDVDVVFDTVGYDTTARSCQVLRPGGTMVCIVTPPPPEELAKYDIVVKFYGAHPDSAQLAEIARLIDAGQVKPCVDKVLQLEQVNEALQLSQGRHVRGKLVLSMEG
jgi:NADPH:quinone reductase-like Zn-dependent oxidoreductase